MGQSAESRGLIEYHSAKPLGTLSNWSLCAGVNTTMEDLITNIPELVYMTLTLLFKIDFDP